MEDLFAALCLVFVIEGIAPFIHPSGWRRMMGQASQLDDRSIRTIGALSMLGGLIALQIVRGFA